MTKRVFRYFFDFIDGQQAWLNEMAAQGWRLVKCGQLSYEFESCNPDEYEYAVEFVAGKAYAESKNYKAFLDGMGYKTFYKNVNVGIVYGKVKWRPWAEGAGQFVTAPGGFQKELIIVEKKRDGKPFELHTDLTDSLPQYRTIRNAYIWAVGGMLALAVMCLSFTVWLSLNRVWLGAAVCAVSAIPCSVFGLLCLKPTLRVARTVRKLKEESETNEYDVPSVKKKVMKIFAIIAASVLFGIGLFWIISVGGGTFSSGSALLLTSTSGHDHWDASYKKLNGFRQRSVTLDEGLHIFTIEITTTSGEIGFTVTGEEGREYYKGVSLSTSVFTVEVDIVSKEKLKLRIDAKDHSGSYKVTWEPNT